MGSHELHSYQRSHDTPPTRLDVDTGTLDELLKDNRRVDAIRLIIEELTSNRVRLRADDAATDDELHRIMLNRISGILAADWAG